ncbi:hypothetical protein [Hydrogenophaga sp.]|uniref:hypothetical protein n=1 Tax=Hydrogenophaga sp. TaxID=1904254 RepID=UPI002772ADBD|nr:hypothetical protein [Hydrogenophaga sp.]MDP2418900.1 hypothetical protein [Hydrogenophaga sp.]
MPLPEPGAYEAEIRTAFDHGEPKSLAAPAEWALFAAQRQPAERDVYRKAAARLADKSRAVKVDFDQL